MYVGTRHPGKGVGQGDTLRVDLCSTEELPPDRYEHERRVERPDVTTPTPFGRKEMTCRPIQSPNLGRHVRIGKI